MDGWILMVPYNADKQFTGYKYKIHMKVSVFHWLNG